MNIIKGSIQLLNHFSGIIRSEVLQEKAQESTVELNINGCMQKQ